jgi:hypothetical protein
MLTKTDREDLGHLYEAAWSASPFDGIGNEVRLVLPLHEMDWRGHPQISGCAVGDLPIRSKRAKEEAWTLQTPAFGPDMFAMC